MREGETSSHVVLGDVEVSAVAGNEEVWREVARLCVLSMSYVQRNCNTQATCGWLFPILYWIPPLEVQHFTHNISFSSPNLWAISPCELLIMPVLPSKGLAA